MTPTDLADTVANLAAGQTVTATVHPYGRGCYTLTGTLRDDAGALRLGGWEAVRLADGTAPVYLRGVELHDAVTEPVEPSWTVDEPALLSEIPDHVYHGGFVRTPGPQVSQSALKLLIPPSTPAHFRYQQTAPPQTKRAFDIGRAAHTMALGVGEPMAACPAEYLSIDGKMTTTKAKSWAYLRREEGVVPLTPTDYDMVMRMADALVHHDRIAEVLTDPDKQPEVSAFAPDLATGVWLRGRFDLMGGALYDYKTAALASPDAFRRSAWSYGYHVQSAMYRRLHEVIIGVDPGPMTFLVQEKTPPYLVGVYALDASFDGIGVRQLDDALALYAECVADDHWPGYPDATLSPPAWALRGLDAEASPSDGEPVPLDPTFEEQLLALATGKDPIA